MANTYDAEERKRELKRERNRRYEMRKAAERDGRPIPPEAAIITSAHPQRAIPAPRQPAISFDAGAEPDDVRGYVRNLIAIYLSAGAKMQRDGSTTMQTATGRVDAIDYFTDDFIASDLPDLVALVQTDSESVLPLEPANVTH